MPKKPYKFIPNTWILYVIKIKSMVSKQIIKGDHAREGGIFGVTTIFVPISLEVVQFSGLKFI